MIVPFQKIPTFDCSNQQWSYTDFASQEAFGEFLDEIWSDECDYQFDEDSTYFNEKARYFEGKGYYTDLPRRSQERKEFWKKEGEKCVRGVIYRGKSRTWYLTRDYYFMLNYGRISNKEKGDRDTFLDIRDIQYHLSLYLKRAEVHHMHAILTKKRQMASSLIHCGKVINKYWFDRNSVCKIFASDTTFINAEDGIWKYFNKFRDFLNEHTDWYRNNLPDEEFSWQQRIEKKVEGRKVYSGRMSIISGLSLKMSATKGVGGACAYGYHEEAGIAPKLDATYNFFRPAVESGIYTTGMFFAAGSVGDLKDCNPLKQYMYNPSANKFLAVTSTWVNKERVPTKVGLYIPEQWGMPGFIDDYGNSKTKEAFEYLTKYYRDLKGNARVTAQDYQRTLSQHPIYLDDAFRHRDVSYFPVDLLESQQERIEHKDREGLWIYKPQKGLLKENTDGKVVLDTSRRPQEHGYPIKPEWPDKRGVVTIYEPPDENPKLFTYFGGVDTVEADVTTTSESIFTIDIFKTTVEVLYEEGGKQKKKIEGDRLVATYRGRYDNVEDTNYQAWLLIKMYNAFTFVERSKPNFINYMQRNGRAERYLAKESDVPMFKELNYKHDSKAKFGFVITGHNNMWTTIKQYIKEYLLTEYGYIYKANSDEIERPLRGIDRIDDFWLLEELIQFNEDGNFDRVVSFGAAVIIAKIYQQNRVKITRNELPKKEVEYQPKRPISLLDSGVRRGGPRKPYSLL